MTLSHTEEIKSISLGIIIR